MIYKKITDISTNNIFICVDSLDVGFDVFFKIENLNFSGSIKIKAALGMLSEYERKGILNHDRKIIESSSGNLGVALAMACAAKNYSFTCVTDPNISPLNLTLMKAYGAEVLTIKGSGAAGYVQRRIDLIHQLMDKDPSYLWIDQYSCDANTHAHYSSTAPQILEAVPDLDYLFVGVGSSGTIMGCSKYFREHAPSAKVIAVDPVGSVLFGGQPSNRLIPGIGGSTIPPLLDTSIPHDVVKVDETETITMCRETVRKSGWLIGGSTGSMLSGIQKYAPNISPGSKVVGLAPDSGVNYLDSIDRKSVV